MPTFTALTSVSAKSSADVLSDALETLYPEPYGVGVAEIEDGSGQWEVSAYFTEDPDRAGLALLSVSHDAPEFVVTELPEIDWVSHVRRELAPVEAGRFFVYGSHDADKVPTGVEPLLIEAALAFGTGHHGTTLGCLRALDRLITAGETFHNIADIGCGTAVLAMAAARIWPEPIMASDIDPVAVEVAASNARANDLEGRLICLEAAGFDHPDLQAKAPYDLIFANILKGPLVALAPDVGDHLAPNGRAILSGLLVEQADQVSAAYAAEGITLIEREDIGEWSTLSLQKL
jgi:ribosomal protein L11 methyltransferase